MANKPFILLGTWSILFLELGTLKSFSVLFNHIARDMGITTGQLGMYIGMYHAVTIMSGIVVKVLLDRFSPRSLSMLGGLIGSSCLMMCSVVHKDIYFAISLFFAGLGFSMNIFPSFVSVIHAFGDRYLLPFSGSAMGAGVGMMLLPLLTQKFLEAYSWRGALLILGAINLHAIPSAAFFESHVLSRGSRASQSDPLEIQQTSDTLGAPHSTGNSGNGGDREQHHSSQSDSPGFQCCYDAVTLFRAAFQGAGLHVFKEHPVLIYTLIAAYLHGISYVGWTIFIIPNAEAKGFDARIAIFLSLFGGIGNTIGRLMPGLLNFLNKDAFTSRISFILFGIVGALPFLLNKIASQFVTLCAFATLSGLALGAKTIVKNTSAVDVVPQSLSSTVLPFAMICSGLGEITGGWMTGQIYDITGSMDSAFFTLGCVDIIGVAFILLSLVHEKILDFRSSSDSTIER